MCGEHWFLTCGALDDGGSSPRVRGTLLDGIPFFQLFGIIPACAGNTCVCVVLYIGLGDHPRVCGEHSISLFCTILELGSSPRVRGTRAAPRATYLMTGIIPACAGNTGSHASELVDSGDHPRVCGEHWIDSRIENLARGSSPRVRGTPVCFTENAARMGIIPACAGNTSPDRPAAAEAWDHPRVCGEHANI